MDIELKMNETRTIRGACRILCRKGSLWVTWPLSDDIILMENDELQIKSKGKILMENIGRDPALIRI